MGDFGLQIDKYVRALSPVDFDQLADINNQSFFTDPLPLSDKMQDDTLLEKSSAKQTTLSPNPLQTNGTEQLEDESSKTMKNGLSVNSTEEKKSDILNSSPLHLGLSTADHTVPNVNVTPVSLSSSAGLDLNQWSSAPADDTFFQGFQSINGTVTFQQFPSAPNSVLGQSTPGFHSVSHVGVSGPHQQPSSARRAITAHHNFPQRQANIMLNNHPKSYQNWSSNAHQPPVTWPGQQGQATLCPWASMPPQHQRRSVPNVSTLTPLSMKKQSIQHQIQQHQHQQQTLLAPPKFRRSTSFPGQIHQATAGIKQLDLNTSDDVGIHREGLVTYQVRVFPNYN